MIVKEFNISQNQPVVLIAPLDWGLGHTTRCIPLIKELEAQGCKVMLAATEAIKKIINQECPCTVILRCPGYHIRYSKKKKWFGLKLISQVPSIVKAIIEEHLWLKKILREHRVDAVISDNRLGFYNKKILSVYITHQLRIKAKYFPIEWLLQKSHYFFIRKYDHCWVPDAEGFPNLAGALSHPVQLPARVQFIGPLSRFEQKEAFQRDIDVLVILSGPEPQRSLFENLMMRELEHFKGNACVVRARPLDAITHEATSNHVRIINHADTALLNQLMLSSKMVISRCGYTTVMDLIELNQQAILIPTPGQTEQEYLALHLQEQGLFYTVSENGFSLNEALKKAAQFTFQPTGIDTKQYKQVVTGLIKTIVSGRNKKQ